MTSKHRLFAWMQYTAVARSCTSRCRAHDDCFFGVLQSRVHEVWALRLGTRLETRPRYTPTTCFETFPFPWPPGHEPASSNHDPRTTDHVSAIAEAAHSLDTLRTAWLNPPEWTRIETLESPGSVDGPWKRYVHDPDERGIGTVRWPRLVPRDAESAATLKARTLTNLYNQRPTWLANAHETLDAAVFAAYGWDPAMTDEQLLRAFLALNLDRASAS